MTLNNIITHLNTIKSRENFDAWVSTNINELTDYFYTLTKEDLEELEFYNDFYFAQFTKSTVFKEFEISKNHSEPFDAFLFLIAAVAEKLAIYFELPSIMDHLSPYLPESSVKYRLGALSLIQQIDNTKTDYIGQFKPILETLKKSESFEEENHTQRLVDFLIYYFQKAERKLTERNYFKELDDLKKEFSDEVKINQFHFLGHFAVQELIAGRYPHELQIQNIELSVLYPSAIMENHFKYNINMPVFRHPDSEPFNILMGFDKLTVLDDILERGKTKFDVSFKNIQPNEKVLLYCYFNMKKHFFTSLAVFKKMWISLNDIFKNNKYSPVFIDLGCGPLTSGLALAELYKSETNETLKLNYIGIDISDSMITKAKEFSESDLFSTESTFQFYKNWNDIDDDTLKSLSGKNNPFFLNASYLFANLSEQLADDLAIFVKKLVTEFKNVHFIFQNPDRVDRNTNWERFKGHLKYDILESKVEKIIYKTSNYSLHTPGSEDVYYEILTLKA